MKNVFFALFSLLCTVSFSQTATAPSGAGNSGDPYLITSLDNLYWVSQNASAWTGTTYYQQTADIDATSTSSWFSGDGFVPIGNISSRFYANYDGQGYNISNITIDRTGSEIAIFGFCQGGIIENLNIVNPAVTIEITGANGCGVLAGGAYLSIFNNVSVQGGTLTTNGAQAYAGPVIGRGTTITVTDSWSSTVVSHSHGSNVNAGLGGFVGYVSGTYSFTRCYAMGNVTKTGGNRTGGFAGEFSNGGVISECYASGNVIGVNMPGGFVGSAHVLTFENCYATGNVHGTASDGKGAFAGFSQSGTVYTNCYATGLLTGYSGGWTGGFSGYTTDATFNNCFWDANNTTYANAFGYASNNTGIPTGETTANMKLNSTFLTAGWDFYAESTNGTEEIWNRSALENNGYPYLRGGDIWNGSTDTDWNTASNWILNEVPIATATVSIPQGCPNYPVLTQNETVMNLTLDGTVSTGGFSLTVGNSVANAGELTYTSGYINGTLVKWIPASTSGAFTFPFGNGSYLSIANVTFTGAPSSGGTLTGAYTEATNGGTISLMDGGTSVTEIADNYWQIEAGNGLSGGTYNITLNTNYIWGVTDVSILRVVKRADGVSPWTLDGTHLSGTGSIANPTVQRTGLSGFSQFTIASPPANSLPVELVHFEVVAKDRKNSLTWGTVSEQDNDYFEVQRSKDGVSWGLLSIIDGAGTTKEEQNYSFDDFEPQQGINYYRLKQIDLNGAYTYSEVKSAVQTIPDGTLYPNPATNEIHFSGVLSADFHLYDILGNDVTQRINKINSGDMHTLQIEALSAGSYILFQENERYSFIKL